jgi:hypothetical protein
LLYREKKNEKNEKKMRKLKSFSEKKSKKTKKSEKNPKKRQNLRLYAISLNIKIIDEFFGKTGMYHITKNNEKRM